MMRVVSVGYQGKKLDSLCDAVVASGVRTLLDVRDRAWSQRPEFRKGMLRAALEARGVEYVHLKVAGNPTRPRPGSEPTAAECEAAYRDHLEQHPEVIPSLLAEMEKGTVALLCFERHRHECHRGVLLAEVARRHAGFEVIDL